MRILLCSAQVCPHLLRREAGPSCLPLPRPPTETRGAGHTGVAHVGSQPCVWCSGELGLRKWIHSLPRSALGWSWSVGGTIRNLVLVTPEIIFGDRQPLCRGGSTGLQLVRNPTGPQPDCSSGRGGVGGVPFTSKRRRGMVPLPGHWWECARSGHHSSSSNPQGRMRELHRCLEGPVLREVGSHGMTE